MIRQIIEYSVIPFENFTRVDRSKNYKKNTIITNYSIPGQSQQRTCSLAVHRKAKIQIYTSLDILRAKSVAVDCKIVIVTA